METTKKTKKEINFQLGLIIGNWGVVFKIETSCITLKWGKL